MTLVYILVFVYAAFDVWCIIREHRVTKFRNKISHSLFNEKWSDEPFDAYIHRYKVKCDIWDKWTFTDMCNSKTPLKLENWYTPEEIGVILKYSNEEF